MENNLECKIETLGLSDLDVSILEKLQYKYIEKPDNLDRATLDRIDLNRLAGSCRATEFNCNSWLKALDLLHKMANFKKFTNKEQFSKLMLLNYGEIDLPEVICVKNQYYINGNGKHRLTMAKCLGLREANVIVRHEL